MKKSGKKFNFRRWLDEFSLAGRGILMVTKEKKFWIGFLVAFLFFGTLMNLLSGGTAKFDLMGALGFPAALQIIGEAIIGVFGVNMIFIEWVPVFLIAVLQGTLIGLIVLMWDKKRVTAGKNKAVKDNDEENSNAANVEKAGIITGLIALGAGCPTCGTTLLTPLLGAIFSTGSLTIAGTISTIVTIVAVVIAVLSLKRMGLEAYVTIINEQYMAKKALRKEKNEN